MKFLPPRRPIVKPPGSTVRDLTHARLESGPVAYLHQSACEEAGSPLPASAARRGSRKLFPASVTYHTTIISPCRTRPRSLVSHEDAESTRPLVIPDGIEPGGSYDARSQAL